MFRYHSADYRPDNNYDDTGGTHFGRLALTTDNSATDSGGNLPGNLINACFTTNPAPDPELENYRKHWKDHLFYVVAGKHDPTQAAAPAADPDTKQLLANYLEGNNLTNFPDAGGNASYQHQIVTGGNDHLFCIESADLIAGTFNNDCP